MNYFSPKKLLLPLLFLFLVTGCGPQGEPKPRLSLFIGVDVSGSFVNSGYFDESINFLAHYIYAHLKGIKGLEKPNVMFVSSIGGASPDEPKSFYPIHIFQNKSVEEIEEKLHEIFPKNNLNTFTDFNAFFEQIALTIRNKNLVLRPVSVVMISDGIPDAPDVRENGETNYRKVNLHSLERLSRNVTLRLLYTNPVVGRKWQTEIPRRRVKIWTQDAQVMTTWNDSTIYIPDKPLAEQVRWIDWTKDNVDYGVRARRVD